MTDTITIDDFMAVVRDLSDDGFYLVPLFADADAEEHEVAMLQFLPATGNVIDVARHWAASHDARHYFLAYSDVSKKIVEEFEGDKLVTSRELQ